MSKNNEITELVKSKNNNIFHEYIGHERKGFVKGTLYSVVFSETEDRPASIAQWKTNFVYETRGELHFYRNETQLMDGLSEMGKHNYWADFFFSINGVSAVIALIIVVVISYMSISSDGSKNIPDIFSNALTIILGFYFGQATKGK